MNILVIGGGGREHALVWKLKQSPRVERIRSEEHTSELQSQSNFVCRPLLEKKKEYRKCDPLLLPRARSREPHDAPPVPPANPRRQSCQAQTGIKLRSPCEADIDAVGLARAH